MLMLKDGDSLRSGDEYDSVVCAESLNETLNKALHDIV